MQWNAGVRMSAYTVEPLYISHQGELIACDYYRPRNIKIAPVIIMAHEFAALCQFKLIKYAQRFAQAGYAVVLFDYRHWGGSTGQPRELVSIQAQITDWYAVISNIRNRKEINKQQIVLWGTGLSGGYALKLASELKDIRAVIAQVPFLDGAETAKFYPIQHYPKAIKLSSQDYMGAKVGLDSITLPVVHPFALSFYPSSDSYNGYMSIVHPDYFWSGEVAARSLFDMFRFRPIVDVHKIRIPALMMVAIADRQTPISASREAATNMATSIQYHEWEMAHFDIYHSPWFEKAISTQLSFLEQILE